MRATLSLIIAVCCSLGGRAAAEEIAPGVEYQGPKRLGIARIGVSFVLPAGWTGGLPEGKEVFLVGKAGANGTLFLLAEEGTVAEARTLMSETIPIDEYTLTPTAGARVSGNKVTNDYSVMGGKDPLSAAATTVIGKTGWGVMVLAISTPGELPLFKRAARQIVRSIRFVRPKKPKLSTNGYWGRQFAGKRIVHFFTGSGYQEKQQILMCPSGEFLYRFNSGGYDMHGFSGAAQSKNGGRWSVSGDKRGGVLRLHYSDGRVAEYNLSEENGKLMLDGQRWYREAIECP